MVQVSHQPQGGRGSPGALLAPPPPDRCLPRCGQNSAHKSAVLGFRHLRRQKSLGSFQALFEHVFQPPHRGRLDRGAIECLPRQAPPPRLGLALNFSQVPAAPCFPVLLLVLTWPASPFRESPGMKLELPMHNLRLSRKAAFGHCEICQKMEFLRALPQRLAE